MWKEWRELRAQGDDLGGRTVIIITITLLLVVGGMAAIAGAEIVRTPMLLVISATPVFAVIGSICEAFAGERERHTLETLLASRLTTEALLAGKIAVNVLYAWGASLLLFALCLVGANTPTLFREPVLPSIGMTLAMLVLLPLMLVFMCAAGVLVSLRSATLRQAQSKLVMFFMGTGFLFLIPFLLIRSFSPELMANAKRIAAQPNFMLISVATWCAILIVADVLLLLAARFRFQRSRMIEIR